ncbi:MAG: GtrA family protein [Eubacteriales bacterium]|nr:GtrA family protein [Clostridiales bacterium]MDD6340896.1 GtrA family protein [Eubacteriales bacterium]MDD7393301.1 GtrA family protein [Eubacteriales bacterium]MDY3760553.1 GtrA family protein [Eubacteriales bacterium]
MRNKLLKLLDYSVDLIYRTMITKGAVFFSNAALDFVLFRLFFGVFSVFAPLSQFLSYSVSTVTRYLSYSFIKFNRTGEGHAVRFARFLWINLFVALLSPLLLSLLIRAGLETEYSKLAVLASTVGVNFLFCKYAVFI